MNTMCSMKYIRKNFKDQSNCAWAAIDTLNSVRSSSGCMQECNELLVSVLNLNWIELQCILSGNQ